MPSDPSAPLLRAGQANYEGIASLGAQLQGKPFVVLAFPDNQYMSQEPGTNAEIAKYVRGSGEHNYPGHPKASWSGTAVPPAVLMAKTNGYAGRNPKPPPWAPGLAGSWCNVTDPSACTPSSADCCATNEAVWKWLARTVPTVPAAKGSYPPSCASPLPSWSRWRQCRSCGAGPAALRDLTPPCWAGNFAGKYLIDKCGKLRGAAGNSAAEPWKIVGPMVDKLLAEPAHC